MNHESNQPLRDLQHEKLCAWILGEADPETAREIEEALERDPQLRAERARLEATISLVRDAVPTPGGLTDEAMERLGDVAREGQQPAPVLRPSFGAVRAAAAAVILLGGGLLTLRALSGGGEEWVADGQPAAVANDLGLQVGLDGQASGTEVSSAMTEPREGALEEVSEKRASGGSPEGSIAPVVGSVGPEGGRYGGRTGSRESADAKVTEQLKALGYLGEGIEPPVAGGEPSREQRLGAVSTQATTDLAGASGAPLQSGQEAPQSIGLSQAEARRSRRADSRSDRSIATGAAKPKLQEKGTYRGPGDSTPPGGAGAGGQLPSTPSGPSSPAPAGPDPARTRSPGPDSSRLFLAGEVMDSEAVTVADDFFLGYGEKAQSADGERAFDQTRIREQALLIHTGLVDDCRLLPDESPGAMYFRWWGDNPFEDSSIDAASTFSVDVDTASYILAKRYLDQGSLAPRAQVRTEEFLNYFAPDLPAPAEGTFGLHTELAPSRFGGADGRWLLRVGVRGKEVPAETRKPLALTFVIDTSGSMERENRLETVKHAVRLLLSRLDARDSIGVVAFSSEARLILPMTSAGQRGLIESALFPLEPSGNTNAEAGLKMGYELARTALDPQTHSRVVFLSDGVANVGQTDQDRISQDVAVHRAEGIYLNTIGVGMGNHNDVFLEQLADKGDGICDYVYDAGSARRAIVERFTGAMIPIASDVKVQVEFNPESVIRYRLLGYENRAIADSDFRNDAVDAGEVGAGHQVVALYELELGPEPDALATVRLRWKEPKAAGQDPLEIEVSEMEHPVSWSEAISGFDSASPAYRRSALVAQLAEFLRRSTHAAGDSVSELVEEATKLALELRDEDTVSFAEMVVRARDLGLARIQQRSEFETVLGEYRRERMMEARLEALRRARGEEGSLEDLNSRIDELEKRLLEVIIEEREALEKR